jgi:hypothetical protein
MALDWEEKVTDSQERKVFEALSNPKWDFRTIEGIRKSTNLSEAQVVSVLHKYPNLVRKSAVPDKYGNTLYTLKSKPVGTQEKLALARAFVIKSIH